MTLLVVSPGLKTSHWENFEQSDYIKCMFIT